MDLVTFDVKKSLADLAEFDQVAANSAQRFNENFTMQLDALSSSFEETAASAASSFNMTLSGIDVTWGRFCRRCHMGTVLPCYLYMLYRTIEPSPCVPPCVLAVHVSF